ncbi:hypothetical protein TSOC_004473 [Tetrabaena socialis]|uniref:Uncharacterized protein n=1 Tax=Tetrabaena socialis TaxID=47790 RepID=A0A2J8A8X5_9CHLO|nr:hypothetical protein TSOC_004473 [Tetrabaena socialis]|eukprot:PNH08960.1 hypothetical protein TSOC_004473 [Tetrabaena socialis]
MGLKRYLRSLCLGRGPTSFAKDDAAFRSFCVTEEGQQGLVSHGCIRGDRTRSSAGGADYDHTSCYLNPLSGSVDVDDEWESSSSALNECVVGGAGNFTFCSSQSKWRSTGSKEGAAPSAPVTPARCPTISFRRNRIGESQLSLASQQQHQQQHHHHQQQPPHHQQQRYPKLRAAKSCELYTCTPRTCASQARQSASDDGAGLQLLATTPSYPGCAFAVPLQPLLVQSPTSPAHPQQLEAQERPGCDGVHEEPLGSADAAVPADMDCHQVCWIVTRPSKTATVHPSKTAAIGGQGGRREQACIEQQEDVQRAQAGQLSGPEELVEERPERAADLSPPSLERLGEGTSAPEGRASLACVAALQAELGSLLRRPDAGLLIQSAQLSESLISGLTVLTVSASLTSFLSRASYIFLPCELPPAAPPLPPPPPPEPRLQGLLPPALRGAPAAPVRVSGREPSAASAADSMGAACGGIPGSSISRRAARHACVLAANGSAAGAARPALGAEEGPSQPPATKGAASALPFAAASMLAAAALGVEVKKAACSSALPTCCKSMVSDAGCVATFVLERQAIGVCDEVASDVSTWRPLRERYMGKVLLAPDAC